MARSLFYVAALLILAFLTLSFASDHEAGNREKRVPSTCTSEFDQFPDHTMCMTDNPLVTKSGVSLQDMEIILRTHNRFRSIVSPPATDLTPLVWNDKLAAVAEKWAKQCKPEKQLQGFIPSLGVFVGQNVAYHMGYRSAGWEAVLTQWWSGKKQFTFGRGAADGNWLKVASYTQIILNATFLVGCGYAECGQTYLFVCNYASGLKSSQTSFPYTPGSSCSACPNNCLENLCQCNGVVCQHGGKLDLNTCTCECPQLWQGPICNKLNCPPQENMLCGLHRSHCHLQDIRNVCPKTCRQCR